MIKNKFETFLIGKHVDLVILNEKVVKNTDWYQWMNFKENTDLLQTGKFPNTLKDQLSYLKNNIESKRKILSNSKINKKLQLGIVEKIPIIWWEWLLHMILIILTELAQCH